MGNLYSYFRSAAIMLCMVAAMRGALGNAAYAEAIPITEVNQVLEGGVTYSYKAFDDVTAQYTPIADGTLRMEGFQGFQVFKECIIPGSQYSGEILNLKALDNGGMVRTFSVKKDETVYFKGWPLGDGEITLFMEGVDVAPLKIQSMDPTPGTMVDFTNYQMMTITFNQNIKLSNRNAVISFENRLTGQRQDLISRATATGTTLSMGIYSFLKPCIASGSLKPDDPFTISILGLTSEYGAPYEEAESDGTIVFNFICGSIPVAPVETYCPDPFLSYWPEDTPEGILKITFEGNLGTSPNTKAELSWGNLEGEEGEYYVEELPVKIDGNVLSVDFTGKLRTPATMTPLFPNSDYSIIGINVQGVVDEYGAPVTSNAAGSVGSFSFAPTFEVLERTSIVAEFEPAPGADINLAANLNVRITGTKGISFDGFQIEYTDKNTGDTAIVTVPMSDVNVTPDGDDATEYAFSMPEVVIDNASNAVVTLSNLVTSDGYNHEHDIRAAYGGFVVTYADPANGTELATLNEGETITIQTNITEKYPAMYVEYKIIDLDPAQDEEEIIKSSSWMNLQENGSFQSEVVGNYKFIYGKDYKVVFTAWENELTHNNTPELTLGSDYVIWKGLTPPFIYSSNELDTILPSPENELPSDTRQLTVNFTGIVNLGKTSGSNLDTGIVTDSGLEAFRVVTPIDPVVVNGTNYASSWILVFPDNYIANAEKPISISFKAWDEEGRQLKGNEGREENSFFRITFFPAGMNADDPTTEVKVIDIDAPEYTVYTLNGICLLRHATPNELRALPAGIYIVNGIKMVIE